jgi:hypothetical protein
MHQEVRIIEEDIVFYVKFLSFYLTTLLVN